MFRFESLFYSLSICFGIIFILSISPASAFAAEKPEIFVQMGHTHNVTSVAFSPDGKYALSGSIDKTIKLWDVATGREIRTFSGSTARVTSIAITPDGRYAVSGDEDITGNIKLWDIISGKQIRTFSGHGGGTGAIAFSPDGKHILSTGGVVSDRTLKLWDVAIGKEVRTFSGSAAPVTSIAVTPDGKYVISGSWDNSVTPIQGPDGTFIEAKAKSTDNAIRVWEIATGRQVRAFHKSGGWVSTIVITPDGKYIISGHYEDSARMWEIASGRQVKVFDVGGVSSIAISPDGKYALFGGVMGMKLWDIAAGREIRAFEGLKGWVRSIAFSPDGKYVLSGDDSTTPKLWDIGSGKETRAFGGYTQQVASVALSPDGIQMVMAQNYGLLNTWDISTGRQLKILKHTLGIKTVSISSDGARVAAGGWDFSKRATTLKVWDIAKGEEIKTLQKEGHFWIQAAVISPDNKYVLWSDHTTLRLSKIDTGREIKAFSGGHKFEIRYAAISADGRFAVSNDLQTTNIWDISTGIIIKSFKNEGETQTVCSDGNRVLVISMDHNQGKLVFIFWDLSTNREIRTLHADYDSKIAIGNGWQGYKHINLPTTSSDGNLVLWSDNRTLHLWDMQSGKEIRTFSGHINDISSIGISPDEKYIYSGSHDGTTRLWDISTGKEIAQFINFTDGEWVVITPEGYFNASANGAKHLSVRVGNNVYSIDNFYEKFFNPVYVASVLQGKKVEAVADIRKGILSPPDVRITSPAPGKEFSTDTLTITVAAKDTGGGIDEIRLYHNGKAIGEDTRAVKIVSRGSEAIREYTVSLVDGVNTFRAVGFSKDRTESNPYELVVQLSAPSKDVSLYVIAVGINKYKNPALNLNYAAPDARGIADFFKQQGKGLFKNVVIREIYNEQATKENIVSKLSQLQNINPQDAVVIYLAGHGENINEKWYFIPHELTYPEREEDVKIKGIPSDELSGYMKNIKAQKILLLIDACKSGAVLIAFRGFEDRKALSQLSRSTGVHIVAASTKDQFAAEVKELGHGVFTYTLLEGLGGKAAGAREAVTVRKLMGYVEERLPEITKKYKQEAQYPVVDSRGMDFPLVMAK
jgi:WD40 repeat protein